MELVERHVGNALLLGAAGRIDHASADGFKAALQPYLDQCKAGARVIVLDFSAVEYISTRNPTLLMYSTPEKSRTMTKVPVLHCSRCGCSATLKFSALE